MIEDAPKIGKCHVCQQEKAIRHCPLCDHWFCGRCRWRLWPRGLGFVKELVGSRAEGCCGPGKEAS